MNRSLLLLPTAIAAALSIAACSPRSDDPTAPRGDGTVIAQRGDGPVAGAREAGRDAANTTANMATDATITTKINAALAADDQLKAIKIDVDTTGGRVVLNGTAPDAASRDRATTLARAVDGVVDVDNRLKVDGKS